jgi:hypothetical protein
VNLPLSAGVPKAVPALAKKMSSPPRDGSASGDEGGFSCEREHGNPGWK